MTTSSPALEPDPIGAFGARLGYEFSTRDSLEAALAHRSWCAENDGVTSNERLEFLGDSVLGLKGLALIGHGSSSAKAVVNAVRIAHELADARVIEALGASVT